MNVLVQAGRAAVSVTSAAEVDLLSTSANGVGVARGSDWTACISTTQNITVRVYVAVGPNAGLVLVSGWTTTATSTAPFTLSVSRQPYLKVRITGQAASTTATVNCDFVGTGVE